MYAFLISALFFSVSANASLHVQSNIQNSKQICPGLLTGAYQMITVINIAGEEEGDGIIVISNGEPKTEYDYYGPEIGRDRKQERREIGNDGRNLELPLEEHRIVPEDQNEVPPVTIPEKMPEPKKKETPKPSA